MNASGESLPNELLLVILTSTEWLNLCSRKSIRLSKNRPIRLSDPPTEKELGAAFAKAPFTKPNSSVDVIAIAIKSTWATKDNRHTASPQDIHMLTLADVVSHQTIAEADREYYQNITAQSGVTLDDSIYEPYWRAWNERENEAALLKAWDDLNLVLGLQHQINQQRKDKYKWREITQLCINPKVPIKTKPAHIETLLCTISAISDAVLGVTDSQKFHIAVNIEWLEHRLQKDPMRSRDSKKMINTALDAADGLDLFPRSENTMTALNFLAETFSKAYTKELTTTSIPLLVDLYMACKSQSSQISQKFVTAINSDTSRESIPLISLMTTCLLGVEMTYQLCHLLSHQDLMDMQWE